MAKKRRRSRGFAGSPEEHDKIRQENTQYAKAMVVAAHDFLKRGECGSALTYLVGATGASEVAKSNRSWVRDPDSFRTLLSRIDSHIDSGLGEFKKRCMVSR